MHQLSFEVMKTSDIRPAPSAINTWVMLAEFAKHMDRIGRLQTTATIDEEIGAVFHNSVGATDRDFPFPLALQPFSLCDFVLKFYKTK